MFKIESKFRNLKKKSEILFRFWDICIWILCYKFYSLRRECLLSAVNGLTNSPKILHITQRLFQSEWRSLFPLKQDFLDIYPTTFFRVRKFKNSSALRVIFLLRIFKIESEFKKDKKNSENRFRFWDKCFWKCSNKSPLLRKEYSSSAVNRLTNSPQILPIIQRDFLNLSFLHRDQ